jgi:NAD-dependent SIR2 family protein deacetylase
VAQPNRAHVALAQLENAGVVSGIITQNVDRLHQRAGSRHVVELHGALADVVCLDCLQVEPRDLVHQRLLEQNPQWLESTGTIHPDGDADLSDRFIGEFRVAACRHCGGTLKPDVVFFGGSVARPTLERALDLLAAARVLLVVGTSLAVFSGYRFVKRAAENGLAIAVINLGPTRADALPIHTRLEARAGEILPRVARALVDVARDVEHSEESRRDRGAL